MAGYRITGKLEGLDDALRRLLKLKQALQNKILRKATTEGDRIIQKRAKALARVGETKMLGRSMGSIVKTYRGKNVVVGIVGPRTGFRRDRKRGRVRTAIGARYQAAGVNPSKYAHLVEKGHRIRRKKGGPVLGMVRPYPFMQPAFDGTKAEVTEAVGRRIGEEIEKEAAKR